MIAAHKPYWMPEEPCYLPVHVGRALHPDIDLGFAGDDTGDNISAKNPHYCELTALYWAWKNLAADYIGLVHYRRYFTRREVRAVGARRKEILTAAEWEGIQPRHIPVRHQEPGDEQVLTQVKILRLFQLSLQPCLIVHCCVRSLLQD